MWIIVAIIVLFVLCMMFIIWALPVLMGLIIIGVGNGLHRSARGKFAPAWWNVVTIVLTIITTIIWNADIFGENVDTGPVPLIILGIYALGSLFVFAFYSAAAKKKEETEYLRRRTGATHRSSSYNATQKTYTERQSTSETYATKKSNETIQTKETEPIHTVADAIEAIADVYEEYGNVWCEEEISLLTDDYSMALSTYPNPKLPLSRIMKELSAAYRREIDRARPLAGALEHSVLRLTQFKHFTTEEVEAIADIYDDFVSIAESLTERYNSVDSFSQTLKNARDIPYAEIVSAFKSTAAVLDRYCKQMKEILAIHSAMNRDLYEVLQYANKHTGPVRSRDTFENDSNGMTRLATVKRNLIVDKKIFDRYGLTFICNLVEDCDTLQLNFELSNTKQLVAKMSRDDEFTIKANVYDKNNNLLCVEETWVEYSQLRSDYVADYLYFSSDTMVNAYSMRIYAIDPVEDHIVTNGAYEDFVLNETYVSQFNNILNDSLKLIKSTVYPNTFFKRLDDALQNAKKIVELSQSEGHRKYAQEIVEDLTHNRDAYIVQFIDRCFDAGKLYSVKGELLSGKYDISASVLDYVHKRLTELEEDDADGGVEEYIYCSISFGTPRKTYYYRTTDETLKCGDEVIVLVGKEGKKSIGTIEKIEYFKSGTTPYPPKLTKEILGKCTI